MLDDWMGPKARVRERIWNPLMQYVRTIGRELMDEHSKALSAVPHDANCRDESLALFDG